MKVQDPLCSLLCSLLAAIPMQNGPGFAQAVFQGEKKNDRKGSLSEMELKRIDCVLAGCQKVTRNLWPLV